MTQVEALPCAGISNFCALRSAVEEIGRIEVACTPRPVLPARAERIGVDGLIRLRTCFLGGDDQQPRESYCDYTHSAHPLHSSEKVPQLVERRIPALAL